MTTDAATEIRSRDEIQVATWSARKKPPTTGGQIARRSSGGEALSRGRPRRPRSQIVDVRRQERPMRQNATAIGSSASERILRRGPESATPNVESARTPMRSDHRAPSAAIGNLRRNFYNRSPGASLARDEDGRSASHADRSEAYYPPVARCPPRPCGRASLAPSL